MKKSKIYLLILETKMKMKTWEDDSEEDFDEDDEEEDIDDEEEKII